MQYYTVGRCDGHHEMDCLVAKLKSYVSHFECDALDPLGPGIEFGDGHDPTSTNLTEPSVSRHAPSAIYSQPHPAPIFLFSSCTGRPHPELTAVLNRGGTGSNLVGLDPNWLRLVARFIAAEAPSYPTYRPNRSHVSAALDGLAPSSRIDGGFEPGWHGFKSRRPRPHWLRLVARFIAAGSALRVACRCQNVTLKSFLYVPRSEPQFHRPHR
jgi:hypothetical protein